MIRSKVCRSRVERHTSMRHELGLIAGAFYVAGYITSICGSIHVIWKWQHKTLSQNCCRLGLGSSSNEPALTEQQVKLHTIAIVAFSIDHFIVPIASRASAAANAVTRIA
jgi:hypothetical protein